MSIGFPSAPAVGTPHSYAGKNWEWTGNGWKRVASGGSTVQYKSKLVPTELQYVYQYIGRVREGDIDIDQLKIVEYV